MARDGCVARRPTLPGRHAPAKTAPPRASRYAPDSRPDESRSRRFGGPRVDSKGPFLGPRGLCHGMLGMSLLGVVSRRKSTEVSAASHSRYTSNIRERRRTHYTNTACGKTRKFLQILPISWCTRHGSFASAQKQQHLDSETHGFSTLSTVIEGAAQIKRGCCVRIRPGFGFD